MIDALASGRPPTLIGTEPGALLAGATIALSLHELGQRVRLCTLAPDPLLEPLVRGLVARGVPVEAVALERADAPVLVGSGALLARLGELRMLDLENARLALVGLGAEACQGIAPEDTAARLARSLADGALRGRSLLRPHDTVARSWIELVEDVHHEIGPARQLPIVDAVRAALFGRHGYVAVDLAARERKAFVSLDTASVRWLDLARLTD